MKRLSSLLVSLLILNVLSAQYFGRNKPRYRNFDFKIYETPHFDIHYYLKNKEVLDLFSQEIEQWYDYQSSTLQHEITFDNPIILYNNHAEFQQTNAISGGIGVGTGGVTEGLKNRVVMPLTFSNQQTHQVLGHELVHAFQFNMIINGDSTSIRNLGNVPLWLIEGLAEYMSMGRVDPFTAMWMRNAILNDDVPSLEDMENPKYFPYRYGQAAWAFLGGYFGDQVIKPFFIETAKYGLELSSLGVFNHDLKTLSGFWENGLKTYYTPFLRDNKESRIGKTLLSKKNSGRLNVSPSLSPNGRWVAFMSERDLFSTDIFLADARNGSIVRKLSSLVKDSDLDNYNFLESAGTWSPDSKKFAFIGFKKGSNVIVIKDAENGKTTETISIDGLNAITNPTWSPDGKEIVVTGSIEGQTDLFAYDLKRKKFKQLTDDIYSEVQAHFNSDGTKLVFSYDKRSMVEGRVHGRWTYDIAVMDYSSGSIETLDLFHSADNINPSYDHEDNIYFMSDRDGYRNMYRYMTQTGELYQMTDFLTGLSGISRYSPVLTTARTRDRVLFTHYYGEEYNIKEASSDELLNLLVDKGDVDFSAGTLPVSGMEKTDIVNAYLDKIDEVSFTEPENFKSVKYNPKFKLDYIGGGAGIGVSNSTFGTYTGLQGGVDLLFGDMLGNHQIFSQVALNGTVYDFGTQTTYINRANKVAWGVGVSHIPSLTGFRDYRFNVPVEVQPGQVINTNVDELNLLRIFQQEVSVFTHLPISSTLRAEAGVSGGRRSFRWDVTKNYYSDDWFVYLGQEREKVDVGDEIIFNQFYTLRKGFTGAANIALVGDNSYFGITSPLLGQRYRLSLERSFGINDYYGILADYRKYIWKKPFSFAFRGLSYTRFDNDVSSVYPVYVGQMGFVRGYDFIYSNSFNQIGGDLRAEQLYGSKILLGGAEIRIPFTGPKQLSLIDSKFLFTDLGFFFDAGMAFDEFSHIADGKPYNIGGQTVFLKPELAMSVGVSVRINLFGAMILEPYWAYPLQENSRVVFGLNFIPGW